MKSLLFVVLLISSLSASAESFIVEDMGSPLWSGPRPSYKAYIELVGMAADQCGESGVPYMVSKITYPISSGKFKNRASFDCKSPVGADPGELVYSLSVGRRMGSEGFSRRELLLDLYKLAGKDCLYGYPRMVSELRVYGAMASMFMHGDFVCIQD